MADIDYSTLKKALRELREQQDRYLGYVEGEYPPWVGEALRESILFRFIVCWDYTMKGLNRFLVEQHGADSSKGSVLQRAEQSLPPGHPAAQWERYRVARNKITHYYRGATADTALELMGDFIGDATDLYALMSGEGLE